MMIYDDLENDDLENNDLENDDLENDDLENDDLRLSCLQDRANFWQTDLY